MFYHIAIVNIQVDELPSKVACISRIEFPFATAIKTDQANPREKEALNLRRGEMSQKREGGKREASHFLVLSG